MEKNRINIVIRKESNPLLFNFMLAEKEKQPQENYTDILAKLVKEVATFQEQALTRNDWTGMRLALRAAEKNSHLTLELLNNILLSGSYPNVLIHDKKSLQLAQAETNWKELMQNYQAQKSSQKVKTLEDYDSTKLAEARPMPSFDFED